MPPSFMRGVDAEWAKPIPGGRGESIWAWMIEKHPQKLQLRTPLAPDQSLRSFPGHPPHKCGGQEASRKLKDKLKFECPVVILPMNRKLDRLERSQIRVFTNLARATPGCISLALGEPDLPTPEPIRAAAVRALEAGRTHYAPNQGLAALRRDIADWETARGHAVTEEEVLITVGATGALYLALTGILNPGDQVIIPTPAFPLYRSIVLAAGAVPVELDLTKTDFQIRKEALFPLITDKTKAILLNSPCNPTGAVLEEESLRAVKEGVLGREIFLVCDNVYSLLCAGPVPDLSCEADLQDRVLLCQSFSKPWSMTGWRVGYLTAPKGMMEKLLLLSAANIACVPTFTQEAAIQALKTDTSPLAEIFRRRMTCAAGRLRSMGLTFPEPKGGFYLFPQISRFGLPDTEFCTRMIREAGVAAVPGSCFGAEGYVRISCCCADAELEEGLRRMEAFLRTL